ncbi:nucleoside triphosphate pyrophosphohydrolase [Romboutsia sp. 1001216sp1]|uniref:nucleoside triphosphate pyrophosphohydrolase n=1 Tax=Romboutsia sp. 1001216sp1 TaxID=2986997 RepID=UPI00232C40B9|nr:nucleoside triphosphate pyrophosphohydrolase [Romboutsia sp. 1001216sp1]MDB8803590.1 nucleoside triphosphate pyrophosphohydrolase [Romboutsia sp. 1001216sp1]MDB8807908.1 nucleoside triphosphate pyrophosphohydrolase [Romboutsia sp. 1001216sp1]MDB8809238.1 nucleoside triphosphate pyrophosphohydrolase [Romboutsia sp. 1001216sp1]MDB8814986.1 nucleoside triphosphate pyrophosphohydrolase [Romboutsia sp. 1001216sp1]MDB8819719.1 nucleoside triphosphate pyrophosphohydrolase [Romboutsia sp. 1001216sp
MKVYDKLVRDRIPEIIEASGNKCEIERVSDELALEYLYKKLGEEVNELLEDKNLDEIADVMEVLFAIGKKYGYSEDDVLNKRNEKRNSRGGFYDNLVLKKTY